MIVEATGIATTTSGKKAKRIEAVMRSALAATLADGVNDPDAIRERTAAARQDERAKIRAEDAQARRAAKIAKLLEQRAQIDAWLAGLGHTD